MAGRESAHSGMEMEMGVMCLCVREAAYMCVNTSAKCKCLHTHKHTYYITGIHCMYTCMCEDHSAYRGCALKCMDSYTCMVCAMCME